MTEPSSISKHEPPPAATPLLQLPNTIKATGAAVLGAVLFGSEIGYWSQTTNFISFNKVMTGDLNIEPGANEFTFLTCTLYLVGTVFALPPVTRIFAGGIGRRKTLILSGFLFAVAMGMQASATYIEYPASRALLWSGRVSATVMPYSIERRCIPFEAQLNYYYRLVSQLYSILLILIIDSYSYYCITILGRLRSSRRL